MPWQDFDYRWTTTWPSIVEYKKGAKSLHEKWWLRNAGGRALDPFLRERWEKAKFEMEVREVLVDHPLSCSPRDSNIVKTLSSF